MNNKKRFLFQFLKRGISFILTLVVISILTFMLVKMQPGDPAVNYLRAIHVVINEQTVEHAREKLHLNKPLPEQYLMWLEDALKGDLGESYTKKRPVLEVVGEATLPTLELGSISFVLLVIFSGINGVLGALYNGRWIDKVIKVLSFLYVSVPVFWLGYMLILIFAVKWQLLPVSGRGDFTYYILPAICLNIPLVGQTGAFIRNVILEEMKKAHVVNAKLRGVKKKDLIINHLLKNIKIPLLTVLSSNVMYVISGSVLIEEVFSWPGLGRMFIAAVRAGDLPLIQGSLLLFGIMAIVLNEGTQALVYAMNPRTRRGGIKS